MAKAKQPELPGVEGIGRIEELQAAALEYAATRDDRMDLLDKEVDLKAKLLTLMQKHHRQVYKVENVEITRVPEGEKLKVRIKKNNDGDEDGAE